MKYLTILLISQYYAAVEKLCFVCMVPVPRILRRLLIYSSLFRSLFGSLAGRRL